MTFVPPTNDDECIARVVSLLRKGKINEKDINAIGDAVSFARGKLIGEYLTKMVSGIFTKHLPEGVELVYDDGSDSEALPPMPLIGERPYPDPLQPFLDKYTKGD